MNPRILGLHHVTATVAGAQADIDCYVGGLGLRLVKRTVNFDNPGVYHFYYGNEQGTPGTLMTTFPYAGKGVREGAKGSGQIVSTTFSVPPGSLPGWKKRLEARGAVAEELGKRFGAGVIRTYDPSGLVLELVEGEGDERAPWVGGTVGDDLAVRGLHGAVLALKDPVRSLDLLTQLLGFEIVGREERRTRLAVGADLPGHYLELVDAKDAPAGINGIGTVHHVAMAVATDAEQVALRERLLRAGLQVTEVRDRQYFRSIYFREPGGVLYEIATLPPGFTTDEDLSRLGCGLMLPPWEEPSRPQIEKVLDPITLPA
jgi:glyoxalase family protein